MKMYGEDRQLSDLIADARQQGIREPVLTLFEPKVPRSMQVLRAAGGNLDEKMTATILAPATAVAFLREHAGIGGHALANFLDQQAMRPNHWMLTLNTRVVLVGVKDNHAVTVAGAYYDDLPYALCSCCWERNPRSPLLPIRVEGQPVPICGHSRNAVAATAALVRVVADRSMPSLPSAQDGSQAPLPVDDALLARILGEHYARSPDEVAEAVRVLRKLGNDGEHRLLSVLAARPELAALRHELLGELGESSADC